MKNIRTISINHSTESGKRVKINLVKKDGEYRWISDDGDCEVTGKTVADACNNARLAWAGSNWDLRGSSLNF